MELLNSFIMKSLPLLHCFPPQALQDLHLTLRVTLVPQSYRNGLCHQIQVST